MANRTILQTDNGDKIILQANEGAQVRLNGKSVLPNEYSAGEGLQLNDKQFSIDTDVVAEKSDIGNGTLTIQKNGETVATFTANQKTDGVANLSIPTNNTQLVNGMGYQTAQDVQTTLSGYADKDLSNLSATGTAKFTNMMLTDASNADPRLATYAELLEVKNMMLGHIDWANKVDITINLTGGVAQNSYTCPSNGYLFPSMGGLNSVKALVNDVVVYTTASGTARTFSGELGGLIPVCEGDILSASSSSGNFSTTLIFIPQKEN